MSICKLDRLGMNRSDVHAGPRGGLLTGVLAMEGLLLLHADREQDLCLRGGVVAHPRLRRRVGVRGPGVETAMDDFDLEGVEEVEQVMMGRGRATGG